MAEDTKLEDHGGIESVSQAGRQFPPRPEVQANAWIKSEDEYNALYKRSIEDPEGFWSDVAKREIEWFKPWDNFLEYDFDIPEGKPYVKYFEGGELNLSHNCLDRHLKARGDKIAIIWEGDDGQVKKYTYKKLYGEVNRFANVLKKNGVKRGDRVTIYLPMIPEAAIAMLACTRVGAIHSVVFGGFSPHSLADRIEDCKSDLLITANGGLRGNKVVELKHNADEAMTRCPNVRTCIVVNRLTEHDTPMMEGRDIWWEDEMASADIGDVCQPEHMGAEDPLYILYTSGSTGKPKGVLHTTGGYNVYTTYSFRMIFDYHEEDVFWCTADVGWVTGHSYVVYGPLSAGATTVMFEGIPNYPEPDRFWEVVDRHKVSIFYTAPTTIRAMMQTGPSWAQKHDLSSLRLIASVGEPINPEAWMWYYENVGRERCPLIDTWWQTETGGILITPLIGAHTLKPGSACKPFFGLEPKVLRQDGTEADVNEGGWAVITKPWPAMIRGVYGDPENKRIKEVYFTMFPGVYTTGDGARVDEDGDYWFMGRIDDVINVSGHRIGTAEVESALVAHEKVSEAAVVGYPHDIKGQGIYAYVTLIEGNEPNHALNEELRRWVGQEIGPIARPDVIQFAPGLPKTRSGKIMRRILRKIAENEISALGDTSTLADPSVVDSLVAEAQAMRDGSK
jgi:acetyl-CoA synthetase